MSLINGIFVLLNTFLLMCVIINNDDCIKENKKILESIDKKGIEILESIDKKHIEIKKLVNAEIYRINDEVNGVVKVANRQHELNKNKQILILKNELPDVERYMEILKNSTARNSAEMRIEYVLRKAEILRLLNEMQ